MEKSWAKESDLTLQDEQLVELILKQLHPLAHFSSISLSAVCYDDQPFETIQQTEDYSTSLHANRSSDWFMWFSMLSWEDGSDVLEEPEGNEKIAWTRVTSYRVSSSNASSASG